MTRLALAALAGLALAQPGDPAPPATPPAAPTQPAIRFAVYDVTIDPAGQPLAAYQLDIRAATPGAVTLVGIEGAGGVPHAPFAAPPFYDPAALHDNAAAPARIVLAAFDTGDALPSTPTRVARLHVRIHGGADAAPEFTVTPITAGTRGGAQIPVSARIELQGEGL